MKRRAALLIPLVLVALALTVRIVPRWSHVVESSEEATIRDPDAAYHLRRAALIAENFPDLAVFDSYINYPEGAHVIWPPLYDAVLAGALTLCPAAQGTPGSSVAVAFLPPIFFAATVLVLFLMARRLWPGKLFLQTIAAGVPALLPASLPYSEIGQLDHHAAELLCTALFLHALANGRERLAQGAAAARTTILPALALAAALATQLSLVLLIGVAFGSILVAPRRTWRRGFESATWIFALAGVVILPAALAYQQAGAPLRHYQFGLFQPALLLMAALASLGAHILCAGGSPLRRGLLVLAPALLLAALAARLMNETTGGLAYVFRQYAPWQGTIGESQLLFSPGIPAGIAELFTRLSLLVLALPFAWVPLARRALAGDARRGILLVASVLFTVIGLEQTRFLPHLALLVGMAAATAAEPWLAPPRRAPRGRTPLAALALAFALVPTLGGYGRDEEPDRTYDRSRSVLGYLASSTPETSYHNHPARTPEYGVVAEWSYGHYIQRVGRRPAVVDNFGDHAGDPTRVRRFFLATDEDRALAFLDSVRSRYVLVRDLAASFQGIIPDEAAKNRFVQRAVIASSGMGQVEFSPAVAGTVLYRLTMLNGGGRPGPEGESVLPLAHFRLVAESEAMDTFASGLSVSAVKLYEVVRGARLRVTGLAPGEKAALLATVSSPRGRAFPYVALLQADAAGALEIVIPYPTVAAAGESRFSDLKIATRAGRFEAPPLDAAAVGAGRTVHLELGGERP
jgi:dolichyl-diphosphooligosaccharide--protein glycosyltransferase